MCSVSREAKIKGRKEETQKAKLSLPSGFIKEQNDVRDKREIKYSLFFSFLKAHSTSHFSDYMLQVLILSQFFI